MNDETSASSSTARAFTAGLCLVLAALLTMPAVVAYWGHRTLTDTERYVDTVEPLAQSQKVQEVLTDKVTAAINDQQAFSRVVRNMLASMNVAEQYGEDENEPDDSQTPEDENQPRTDEQEERGGFPAGGRR